MSDGNWMEDAVRKFMVAMDQPTPDKLDLEAVRIELRAKLILEEAIETIEAMGCKAYVSTCTTARPEGITHGHQINVVRRRHAYRKHPNYGKPVEPDWPEVVDGLCDLMYVTLGVPIEAGFRIAPFFAEVHRSNMTKTGGPVRGDGKVLKPDTFEPPRMKYLWDRVLKRAGIS